MAENADSTRARARERLPETSTTTRRAALASLAAAAALPAAGAALSAPAASPASAAASAAAGGLSTCDPRLADLLARFRQLQDRIRAALDLYNDAEEARRAAAEAHPYPLVTEDDQTIFNYAVRPGYDWTPARLSYFNNAAFHSADAARAGADVRKARVAELVPIVAAAEHARRPFEKTEAAAQEIYEVLIEEEAAILTRAADIAGATIADAVAKAAMLAHYNGGLDFESPDVSERMRDSVLRDLMAMGGAHG